MSRTMVVLGISIASLVFAGCSSATPSPTQPHENVASGIRVDVDASSDDGSVPNPARAIQPAKAALGRCYSDTLATRPGVAGHVAFVLAVDSDGRADHPIVTPDATLADDALKTCLEKALKSVVFAGPVARVSNVHGTLTLGAL